MSTNVAVAPPLSKRGSHVCSNFPPTGLDWTNDSPYETAVKPAGSFSHSLSMMWRVVESLDLEHQTEKSRATQAEAASTSHDVAPPTSRREASRAAHPPEMTNVGVVVVSHNVFAKLPSYNPFVGTFHHAPRCVFPAPLLSISPIITVL